MDPQALDKQPGWITFATIILFAVGFFRIISGISYLAKSHKIENLAGGIFSSNVWVWGLWDLGIAALALYGGYSLLNGGEFGRIVAYLWAILVIVNSFMIFGLVPWYAAASLVVAILVVYGLSATSEWSKEQRAA
jgi:hypothetical protein